MRYNKDLTFELFRKMGASVRFSVNDKYDNRRQLLPLRLENSYYITNKCHWMDKAANNTLAYLMQV